MRSTKETGPDCDRCVRNARSHTQASPWRDAWKEPQVVPEYLPVHLQNTQVNQEDELRMRIDKVVAVTSSGASDIFGARQRCFLAAAGPRSFITRKGVEYGPENQPVRGAGHL